MYHPHILLRYNNRFSFEHERIRFFKITEWIANRFDVRVNVELIEIYNFNQLRVYSKHFRCTYTAPRTLNSIQRDRLKPQLLFTLALANTFLFNIYPWRMETANNWTNRMYHRVRHHFAKRWNFGIKRDGKRTEKASLKRIQQFKSPLLAKWNSSFCSLSWLALPPPSSNQP